MKKNVFLLFYISNFAERFFYRVESINFALGWDYEMCMHFELYAKLTIFSFEHIFTLFAEVKMTSAFVGRVFCGK